MISKKDLVAAAVNAYPEIGPILSQAGLHCVGCHISEYETIEDGVLAHGISEEDLDELIVMANDRIKLYENLPKLSFTKNAVLHLKEKIATAKSKYVRVTQLYGGEFDFEAVDKKEPGDIELNVGVPLLIDIKIERMLRGLEIDYDTSAKDFTAKQVNQSAVSEKK